MSAMDWDEFLRPFREDEQRQRDAKLRSLRRGAVVLLAVVAFWAAAIYLIVRP